MARKIIHDHDIAGTEFRHQHLLDIGLEGVAVDRAVEDHGRRQAGEAEASDEGRGLPMPLRDAGAQPLALGRPAMEARHVGRRPSLIDEDETLWIEFGLVVEPVPAPL